MAITLISILALSVAVYFISKLSWKVGAVINALAGAYLMIYLFTLKVGSSEVLGTLFGEKLLLTYTNASFYFSFVSMLVILAVMVFAIKWLDSQKYPSAFNMFLLMMTAASLGVFFAGDLLTLYIFWEIAVLSSMLIVPMGKKEARRAAIIYAVMSATGTYMYLYASFMIYSRYGNFNLAEVAKDLANDPSMPFKVTVYLLLAAAGIAKSGIFPLHTWLRIAHGNAPDAFSAVLSGQLVKLGSYVLMLVTAFFPTLKMFQGLELYSKIPSPNYFLLALGATSIIVGTLMAIKQDDMKMLIAFSSVANGGYILVGIATMDAIGFEGGILHVFNHALAAAIIFMAFASVVYRTHTTKISEMGGLIHKMPITFISYLFAIISLAGIPPMSGFISKWMIYQALVRKGMFVTAFIAFFGSIGSFLYVFRPLAGVFLGQLPKKYKDVKEVPAIMWIPMVTLVAISFIMGVWPFPILKPIEAMRADFAISPSVKIADASNWLVRGVTGSWNPVIVFNLFIIGFAIAYLLYTLFPKPKKVDLLAPHKEEGAPINIYTGGEYIYTPDLYQYNTKMYAGFERMYEKHPSWEKVLDMLCKFFHDLGQLVHGWFFRPSPSAYAFWTVMTLLIVFWVRW